MVAIPPEQGLTGQRDVIVVNGKQRFVDVDQVYFFNRDTNPEVFRQIHRACLHQSAAQVSQRGVLKHPGGETCGGAWQAVSHQQLSYRSSMVD